MFIKIKYCENIITNTFVKCLYFHHGSSIPGIISLHLCLHFFFFIERGLHVLHCNCPFVLQIELFEIISIRGGFEVICQHKCKWCISHISDISLAFVLFVNQKFDPKVPNSRNLIRVSPTSCLTLFPCILIKRSAVDKQCFSHLHFHMLRRH